MKTLRQIREEYDDNFMDGVMPDELMFESSIESPKSKGGSLMPTKGIPSAKEMPVMLIFRRISYRIYPNKQVVALYYSSMIDKYLSIPFGPGGNVNLSEASIIDNLDEDWQDVNRKDKTDGLSQKAVNAYRRENPGSKLQTAVTEKNPSGKRAARRKSFCSRMGGMKKRLTSAKTARDPDSRINKALRRWNCEEDFKMKLNEKRMQSEDALDVATFAPGFVGNVASGMSAIRNVKKGKYLDAALDAVGAVDPTKAATGVGLSGIAKGARLGYKATKALSSASKASKVAKPLSKATKVAKPGMLSRIGKGIKDIASSAVDKLASTPEKTTTDSKSPTYGGFHRPIGGVKTSTSWSKSSGASDAVAQSKLKQAALKDASKVVKENKMSDIRAMIESNESTHDMIINGKTITLNTSMAKRILEVYDSVNTKNKKIVEGMLNEDLESFKKLLNFSIRK